MAGLDLDHWPSFMSQVSFSGWMVVVDLVSIVNYGCDD